MNCQQLLSHEMTDQINSSESDQFTSTDIAPTLRAVHYHLTKVFLSCTRGHVCDTSTRVTCLLLDAPQTSQASQSYTSARSSHCIDYTFRSPRCGYHTILFAVALSTHSRCCRHLKSDLYIADLDRTANRSSTRVPSASIRHAVGMARPAITHVFSVTCSYCQCNHLNLQIVVLGFVVHNLSCPLQLRRRLLFIFHRCREVLILAITRMLKT